MYIGVLNLRSHQQLLLLLYYIIQILPVHVTISFTLHFFITIGTIIANIFVLSQNVYCTL